MACGLAGLTLDFNGYDFSIVGPDGVTESNLATDTAAYCLDEGDMVPYEIGPGENVVGKVALDTKNAEGVLVYKPWYGGGAPGWEWEY